MKIWTVVYIEGDWIGWFTTKECKSFINREQAEIYAKSLEKQYKFEGSSDTIEINESILELEETK